MFYFKKLKIWGFWAQNEHSFRMRKIVAKIQHESPYGYIIRRVFRPCKLHSVDLIWRLSQDKKTKFTDRINYTVLALVWHKIYINLQERATESSSRHKQVEQYSRPERRQGSVDCIFLNTSTASLYLCSSKQDRAISVSTQPVSRCFSGSSFRKPRANSGSKLPR